jgi:hypothetical protein
MASAPWRTFISVALAAVVGLAPANAQSMAAAEADDDSRSADIVVTAPRILGSAVDDIAPEITINEAEIEGYGASSVAELLAALSPQTRSGRGRGDGAPVILVNGRRIANFAEIRDLPPEAILRVEVLPEDAALRFGFAADQRVTNFILRPNFRGVRAEAEQGESTSGGRGETELTSSLTTIGERGRTILTAEYARRSPLTEDERGIDRGLNDPGEFRTLLAESDEFTLNGTITRALSDVVNLTLNGRFDYADRQSLFGLSAVAAPGASDPLTRDATSQTVRGSLTLDGALGKWQSTLTANIDRTRAVSLTDSSVNSATRDRSASTAMTADTIYTLTGALFELPAGRVQTTLRTSVEVRRFDSESTRAGVTRNAKFGRDEVNARVSIDVPLTDAKRGVGAALGDFSVNLNAGYRQLDDFSALTAFGFGLNWTPTKGLNILTSFNRDETAPAIQQLGEPQLVTPGVPVFDFTRQATVIVNRLSGGNPGLRAETRRDIKVGATYEPTWLSDVTLSANYFRNRSFNTIASFPSLTPETERAFPERFIRDASGTLTAIDQRPINYAEARSDQLRIGFNISKQKRPPGASGGVPGAGGPRGGGGGGGLGRGGGGFGGRGGQGSGFQIGIYDTIRFSDDILLRSDIPRLDLLNGSAVGSFGGSPRHSVELESGVFKNGIGFRLSGNYQSATSIKGGLGSGSTSGDLNFSDLLTLNARLFVNFDGRKSLIKRAPFLKGTRLALRIDNLTNEIRDVRDATGAVPFSFLPGFVDPRGRFIEISLRKVF